MKTIVLIPAYNESAQIAEVVKNVKSFGFEVAVVDDGSIDQTTELAKSAGAVVLVHKINRGQGAAIKTGLEYALLKKYDSVVFFDADGQMNPAEINLVLEPITSGKCEVVLGSRFLGQVKNISWSKLITLKLALFFTKITTGLRLTDTHNGFQAWTAGALKKINLVQDRMAYASELLSEIADHQIKYREAPVTIEYTDYSKSKGQSILNSFNILWDLLIKK